MASLPIALDAVLRAFLGVARVGAGERRADGAGVRVTLDHRGSLGVEAAAASGRATAVGSPPGDGAPDRARAHIAVDGAVKTAARLAAVFSSSGGGADLGEGAVTAGDRTSVILDPVVLDAVDRARVDVAHGRFIRIATRETAVGSSDSGSAGASGVTAPAHGVAGGERGPIVLDAVNRAVLGVARLGIGEDVAAAGSGGGGVEGAGAGLDTTAASSGAASEVAPRGVHAAGVAGAEGAGHGLLEGVETGTALGSNGDVAVADAVGSTASGVAAGPLGPGRYFAVGDTIVHVAVDLAGGVVTGVAAVRGGDSGGPVLGELATAASVEQVLTTVQSPWTQSTGHSMSVAQDCDMVVASAQSC